MYTVSVEEKFSGAHRLVGYEGKCSRLHGHNWRVSASVEVSDINQIGISIDFESLRLMLREILGELDHRFLNEIPGLSGVNPTAENIASYVFKKYSEKLQANGRVTSVTVWESDTQSVTYSP